MTAATEGKTLVCALCYGRLRKSGMRVEPTGKALYRTCAECGQKRYTMFEVVDFGTELKSNNKKGD